MLREVTIRNMTSNTAPWPYVASSSSCLDAGLYPTWGAFDGNASVWWVSGSVFPAGTAWLQIRLQSSSRVVCYKVQSRNSGAVDQAPKSFSLQGSSDGQVWFTLDQRTNQVSWGNAEIRTYYVENLDSFDYYRLFITEVNGSTVATIGELYLYAEDDFAGQTVPTALGFVGRRFLGTETETVLPPSVSAGPDQYLKFAAAQSKVVTLAGSCGVSCEWSKVWGPGTVTFTDDTSPTTNAEFSAFGIHRLRLTADDGVNTNYSDVVLNLSQYTAANVTQVVVEYLTQDTAPEAQVTQVVLEVLSQTNVGGKVAQEVIETISSDSVVNAVVAHQVIETLFTVSKTLEPPRIESSSETYAAASVVVVTVARISQEVVEVLTAEDYPAAQVSQYVVESLTTDDAAPALVSQYVVETLTGSPLAALVSQLVVEVLTQNVVAGGGERSVIWMGSGGVVWVE